MEERRRLVRMAAGRPPDRGAAPGWLRGILLAATGAAAAGWIAGPAAAQNCATLTPSCVNQHPHPEITPVIGIYSTPSVSVTVTWTDDHNDLNESTKAVTLNGTNVWSGWTDASGPNTDAASKTLTLAPGKNTIVAHVCDNGSLCGDYTAEMFYQPRPASQPYAAAGVYLRTVNEDVRPVFPGDAIAGYSMPGYVSRGSTMGADLVYTASQATGRTSVKVNTAEGSQNTPSLQSIAVRDSATGAWVTAAPTYYLAGPNGGVLAANWTAADKATGMRTYEVVVTSIWQTSRGAAKDTTIEAPPLRFHALHLNEGDSPFGAGWTMPGLQRAYPQANGSVMITPGDGSAVAFRNVSGALVTPEGEFSTLVASGSPVVYTRSWPDGSKMVFRADGRMTSAEDRFGSRVDYAYDGSGRVATQTDAAGKVTTFAYYSSGAGVNANKLYTITDPGGRTATFAYDAANNLTDITGPDGVVAFHGTYAASPAPAHRLRTRTLRGRTWSWAYDAAGLVAADTLPTVSVEGVGLQRPVTRILNVDTRSLGGTLASPAPRVTNSGSDFTDARGITTSVTFDAFALPAFILGPYDHTIIARNSKGQPLRVTTPSGAVTTYAWNGPDLLHARESAPSSLPPINRHTDHWPSAALFHLDTLVIDANAPVHNRYGAHGELLRTWSGTDSTRAMVYTYYAADRYRLASSTDPAGHRTDYVYQAAGAGTGFQNLFSVTTPDPAGGTRQTTYGYDAQGRTVTATTPAGTSSVAFDVLNRQTLAVDAAGDSTRFGFPADSVSTVTDAGSKVYTFYQNALGWLTKELHPDTKFRTYGYDPAGNLARSTDRRSLPVTFTYDSINRVKTRTADGITTTFGYGPATSPWFSAGNSLTTDTLYFDQLGRTARELSVFAGTLFTRQSFYLAEGPRRSLVYTAPGVPDGGRADYDYDNALRLTGISSSGDYLGTTIGYDGDGLPSQVSTPMSSTASLVQGMAYTPTHQPASQGWNVTSVNTALGRLWEYDALDRLVQRSNATDTQRRAYGYDNADRLTSKEDLHSSLGPLTCDDPLDPTTCSRETVWTPDSSAVYPYDRVGNRTDAGTTMVSGTNRYTTFRGFTLGYDYEGNLTSKTKTGYSQTYTWNALGELASVTTNGVTVSYTYDGFGRRVKRAQGSTVNYFVYDGDNLLLETDGSGTVLREYAYYPGIDQPYSLRSWSGGVATKYYYTIDFPGNVSGLVNTSRQVANEYRYTPWGEAESTTEAVPQPLRYMAREIDSTTGLYYVRARWYDPALARFNSEDPIGLDGGVNQYTYVGNSPTNSRDPSGLDADGECPEGYEEIKDKHGSGCYNPVTKDYRLKELTVSPGKKSSGHAAAPPSTRGDDWDRHGLPPIVLYFTANDNDRRKFQGCRQQRFEHYETEGAFPANWMMERTNIEQTYPRVIHRDGRRYRPKLAFQRWVWYKGRVMSPFGLASAHGYVWCETGDAQFESQVIMVP